MKIVFEAEIKQINESITYIKEESGIDYAKKLGIDEIEIGRKMILAH